MPNGAKLRRRSLFPLLAGAALSAGAREAEAPTLLVAGLAGGELATWAALLAPALASELTAAGELRLRHVGGRDGVTGLNQFQAWAEPDGAAALLFPGGAALAWLASDDRVRFDAFRLVPMLAITSPALLLWRGAGQPARRPLRLACPAGSRAALPGLLALHLLGHEAELARGGEDELQAVHEGTADAVFLAGENVPARALVLRRAGLMPLVAAATPAGRRDPAFSDVPLLAELRRPRRGVSTDLASAWQPAVLAAQMRAVLALPPLCPAANLARWRRAARSAQGSSEVSDEAAASGLQLHGPQAAPALLAGLQASPQARMALAEWIAASHVGALPDATVRDSLFLNPGRAN